MNGPRVSVVTTMHRSAPYLIEFRDRVIKALSGIDDQIELVLVDDGSPPALD